MSEVSRIGCDIEGNLLCEADYLNQDHHLQELPPDLLATDRLRPDLLPPESLPQVRLPLDRLPPDRLPIDRLPPDVLLTSRIPPDLLPTKLEPPDLLPQDQLPTEDKINNNNNKAVKTCIDKEGKKKLLIHLTSSVNLKWHSLLPWVIFYILDNVEGTNNLYSLLYQPWTKKNVILKSCF